MYMHNPLLTFTSDREKISQFQFLHLAIGNRQSITELNDDIKERETGVESARDMYG